MSEALIAWGIERLTGIARHVTEVRAGLACACVCPGCKGQLEAVNSENPNPKRRPYFRHHQVPESGNCATEAVAAATRRVLLDVSQLGELRLPAFSASASERDKTGELHFAQVTAPELVVRVAAVSFIDEVLALLTLDDGKEMYVVLRASSTDPTPNTPAGAAVLVYDLEGRQMAQADAADLRARLRLLTDGKSWICHLQQADLLLRAKEAARNLAQAADEAAAAKSAPPEVSAPVAGVHAQQFAIGPRKRNLELALAQPAEAQPVVRFEGSDLAWSTPTQRVRVEQLFRRFSLVWPGISWGDVYEHAEREANEGRAPGAALELLAEDYGARIGVVRDFLSLAGLLSKV